MLRSAEGQRATTNTSPGGKLGYHCTMEFQLVQTAYWTALALWSGSVMFIAIATPVIVATIRNNTPILPKLLSVNDDGHHGELLAGEVVGKLQGRAHQLGMMCAAVIAGMMIVHPFVISTSGNGMAHAIVRAALYVASLAIALYDWRLLWPKIWEQREKYVELAEEPEKAQKPREEFDRLHRLSVNLLLLQLLLLIGLILFSGNIRPLPVWE